MVFSYRLIRIAVVVSCALIAGYASVGMAAPAPKVAICHLPPGNPTNVQGITVGAPAALKHVAQHGDLVCAEGNSDCCVDEDDVVCTNLQTDVNNCGSCGTSCDAGETCTDGECEATPVNTLDLICHCEDATNPGLVCDPTTTVCGTSCSPDVASQLCATLCAETANCPSAGVPSVRLCEETFTSACVP
jgi:hypothetical protein